MRERLEKIRNLWLDFEGLSKESLQAINYNLSSMSPEHPTESSFILTSILRLNKYWSVADVTMKSLVRPLNSITKEWLKEFEKNPVMTPSEKMVEDLVRVYAIVYSMRKEMEDKYKSLLEFPEVKRVIINHLKKNPGFKVRGYKITYHLEEIAEKVHKAHQRESLKIEIVE